MSDALERLIEAVDAGSIRSQFDPAFERAIYPQVKIMGTVYLAGEAYLGSLDAARDLHNALLPAGWEWKIGLSNAVVWLANGKEGSPRHSGMSHVAARAWLLAILKAKLAAPTPAAPSARSWPSCLPL